MTLIRFAALGAACSLTLLIADTALAQPAPANDPKASARERVRAQRNYDPRARIATTRLPAPVTVNPEWERMFREQFAKFFPGDTLIKQSLYSRDWYVKRHPITNEIEYRQIGTNFAVKGADGSCRIVALDYYETWQSGGYQRGYFQDGFKQEPILCENI
ncbi:hypothetical protein [Sphingomonas sp. G-3-2-10]|uniref:hypothetical protein n=1 Tax=Sphingomonas sp. G-3-2-10 TaxID=2728838 RepID=UPI00146A9BBD|nr:hypothetical protein [Sphingomonas sp. G-3-2-10]NML04812.1 hypothetical protein [Sphingomonas sp. G-3-2-10]